jgi:hypothetical protein
MTELSPAAKEVLHSFWDAPVSPARNCQIAAALRAAADQVVPEQLKEPHGTGFRWGGWAAEQGVRNKLLAIAAELDNTSQPS